MGLSRAHTSTKARQNISIIVGHVLNPPKNQASQGIVWPPPNCSNTSACDPDYYQSLIFFSVAMGHLSEAQRKTCHLSTKFCENQFSFTIILLTYKIND